LTRTNNRKRIALLVAANVQPIHPFPLRKMFPLKLVRKTANGDLLLEGQPVYIAGSVATTADLPVSGEAAGECYLIGNTLLGTWNGKQWLVGDSPVNTSDAAAIDAETINRTLLQTGFQAIT